MTLLASSVISSSTPTFWWASDAGSLPNVSHAPDEKVRPAGGPRRSETGRAVDPLAQQVRVSVVPGVLLDHVLVDPAQRHFPVGIWRDLIQAEACHGGS